MFSQSDLDTIRAAVEAAERRTRGEIVPMVVPASARYRDASHLAGLIVTLVVLALLLTLDYDGVQWIWASQHPGWILLGMLTGYAFGNFMGRLPTMIRLLTPHERM